MAAKCSDKLETGAHVTDVVVPNRHVINMTPGSAWCKCPDSEAFETAFKGRVRARFNMRGWSVYGTRDFQIFMVRYVGVSRPILAV